MSTMNHISHCSTYLRANIHNPTIDNDVVKASATGTVESVNLTSIHHNAAHNAQEAAAIIIHSFAGVWVIGRRELALSVAAGHSLDSDGLRGVVFPVHDQNPYIAINR